MVTAAVSLGSSISSKSERLKKLIWFFGATRCDTYPPILVGLMENRYRAPPFRNL
jgi:hypothetical protein